MKNLIYDITNQCNLRCKHCYNSEYFDSQLERVNPNKMIDICNYIEFNRIHLVGGEPLIEPELLKFIDGISNAKISINTNGIFLNEQLAEKILENEKVDQITVSLDGSTRESYEKTRGIDAIDLVCKNIANFISMREFKNKKCLVNVAFVITEDNYSDLFSLYCLCEDLLVDNLMICQLYFEGSAKKNYLGKNNSELIANSILNLVKQSKNGKTKLIIDAKPIFLLWLSLKSSVIFDCFVYNKCCADEGNLYLDSYGSFYKCGPASKSNSNLKLFDFFETKSQIKNKIYSLEMKSKTENNSLKMNCKYCLFSSICNSCPMNILSYSDSLCEFAKKECEQYVTDFLKLRELKIQKNVITSYNKLLNTEKKCFYVCKYLECKNCETVNIEEVFNKGNKLEIVELMLIKKMGDYYD